MLKLALIAAGGALGSVLRYGVGVGLAKWTPGAAFPFGTLAVNLVGCFLIGLFNGLFLGRISIPLEYRVGLTAGVLGGFTTFSAFGWETVALAEGGQWRLAAVNVLVSVLAGLAAVWIGWRVAERWGGAA